MDKIDYEKAESLTPYTGKERSGFSFKDGFISSKELAREGFEAGERALQRIEARTGFLRDSLNSFNGFLG